MYKYLKEEIYYHDLYDLGTVERCLEIIDFWENKVDLRKLKGRGKKGLKERTRRIGLGLELHFTKGERYRERDSTIRGWVENDQRLDEFVEKATEPANVRCPACSGQMRSMLKQLHRYDTEQPRVLFLFECQECKKRKGIFPNGGEYISEPTLCPRCSKEINFLFRQKGDIEIWEKKCSACGFHEREEIDSKKRKEEREAEQKRNQELLM